eukprot:s768_g13.t2
MNSVVCPECKAKVCLKHRFEDHHPCRESKREWLSRLSSDRPETALPHRAAQNWGSGVTGTRIAAPQHASEAKLSYNQSLSESVHQIELKLRTPCVREASTGSEVVEARRLVPEAAASKLLELRRALGNSEEAGLCLSTLRKLLSNVAADPQNPKFRSVKRENKAIQQKILQAVALIIQVYQDFRRGRACTGSCSEELMKAIGFEDAGEMLRVCSAPVLGPVQASTAPVPLPCSSVSEEVPHSKTTWATPRAGMAPIAACAQAQATQATQATQALGQTPQPLTPKVATILTVAVPAEERRSSSVTTHRQVLMLPKRLNEGSRPTSQRATFPSRPSAYAQVIAQSPPRSAPEYAAVMAPRGHSLPAPAGPPQSHRYRLQAGGRFV